ncbi:MAG: hypothetical protein V7K68_26850 [Nostoc sp.]|uniref:hypothetical protein n=1 Tax=Nostoc sp. TaxID=1180 RepID=UPI002FF8B24E
MPHAQLPNAQCFTPEFCSQALIVYSRNKSILSLGTTELMLNINVYKIIRNIAG